MAIKSHLDPKDPLLSLATFSERHLFLPPKEKRAFLEAMQELFEGLAYNDDRLEITQATAERLNKLDLPTVYRVMSEVKYPNPQYHFAQLLANVSKVAVAHFSLMNSAAVYQLCVHDSRQEDAPLYWGWILKEFSDSSKLMLSALNEKRGTIRLKEVPPAILWTLQRFQELYLEPGDEKEIAIPLPLLIQLYSFAKQWQMSRLQKELLVVFEGTIVNNRSLSITFKSYDDQDPAHRDLLEDFQKHPWSKKPLRYKYSDPKMSEEIEGEGNSPRFNPNDPYGSIRRFSARCASLRSPERMRFLSAVSDFFAHAAYANLSLPIPEQDVSRFANIDLPFLLSILDPIERDQRERLIATMQRVSGKIFTCLGTQDHVAMVDMQYDLLDSSGIHHSWISGHPEAPGQCPKDSLGCRDLSSAQLVHQTEVAEILNGKMALTSITFDRLAFLLSSAISQDYIEFKNIILEEVRRRLQQASYLQREEMQKGLALYYDQRGFVPALQSVGVTIQPPFESMTQENLTAILLEKITAQPSVPITTIFNAVLSNSPHRATIQESIWDALDQKRKEELFQSFIEELKRKFKIPSSFKWLELEEVSRHLLFNQRLSFHVRDPDALCDFLFSEVVVKEFMNSKILQRMKLAVEQKMPDYYVSNLANQLCKRFAKQYPAVSKNLRLIKALFYPQSKGSLHAHLQEADLSELISLFTSEEFAVWQKEIGLQIDYAAVFRERFDIPYYLSYLKFAEKIDELIPFIPYNLISKIASRIKSIAYSAPIPQIHNEDPVQDIARFFWAHAVNLENEELSQKLLSFLTSEPVTTFFEMNKELTKLNAFVTSNLRDYLHLLEKLKSPSKLEHLILEHVREIPHENVSGRIIDLIWQFSRKKFEEYSDLTVSESHAPATKTCVELITFFDNPQAVQWIHENFPGLEINTEILANEIGFSTKHRIQNGPHLLCLSRVKQLMMRRELSSEIQDYLIDSYQIRLSSWRSEEFVQEMNREPQLDQEEKQRLIQFLKEQELKALTASSENVNSYRTQLLNYLEPPSFIAHPAGALSRWFSSQ